MSTVLVLCEPHEGAVAPITLELLGLARGLADPSGTTALRLGPGPVEPELSAADRLVHIDDVALTSYDAEPWLIAATHAIRRTSPRLVLLGHTARGMELAPALAARLGAPLVTDVVGLSWQGDSLTARRHRCGGKVCERLTLRPAPIIIASVRPGTHAPASPPDRAPDLLPVEAPDLRGRDRRLLRIVEAALQDVDITDADLLVSVGRGLGKPENLPKVEAFARAIGATISCSRPVADKGWLPKSRQVGTSGRTVRPKVYLALGISGAYQHVAGMRGAGTILAVNTDPAAPIFEVAHAGIVADLFDVLPLLQSTLAP